MPDSSIVISPIPCPRLIDAAGSQRLLARGAAADRPKQRFCVVAEEAEQQ
jgi:hypothetical protein